jgi:Asp-tRNA(Asn)/Glu-tRNA(Gln) amidotransferase A subunit family amidase
MPALSLCNDFGASVLPLSIKIAGGPFDKYNVFRLAYVYEQAGAWHNRYAFPWAVSD